MEETSKDLKVINLELSSFKSIEPYLFAKKNLPAIIIIDENKLVIK